MNVLLIFSFNRDYYEQLNYSTVPTWIYLPLKFVVYTEATKKYQIKQSEINSNGKYPVISQSSNEIEGYSDREELVYQVDKPVIIFGDHTRNIKIAKFPFIVGADGVKILNSIYSKPEFLKLQITFIKRFVKNRGYARHYSYFEKVIIPIPDKRTQENILEKFTKFSQLLKKL